MIPEETEDITPFRSEKHLSLNAGLAPLDAERVVAEYRAIHSQGPEALR